MPKKRRYFTEQIISKLRETDRLLILRELAEEISYLILEAQVIIKQCGRYFNEIRPHSALGYKPPTQATFIAFTSQLQLAGGT
jgi:transposase InsO family protein